MRMCVIRVLMCTRICVDVCACACMHLFAVCTCM